MKSFQLDRKLWVILLSLLGLISMACSFNTIIDGILYKARIVPPHPGNQAYEGVYTCQEVKGQTFYGSLGMPSEIGVEQSLAGDDLIFEFRLSESEVTGVEYSFHYEYSALLRQPTIYYDNNNIVNVEQTEYSYTAKTKSDANGYLQDDNWFVGSWIEIWEYNPPMWGVNGSEKTWEYIGVVDFDRQTTRIQLCSWYKDQRPNLEAAKATGSNALADFCKDWNYFACYMVEPE